MTQRLTVNEQVHEVELAPSTPLLWALRDTLGLTGTKYGCGVMACGACTVLVDGVATRSCGTPLSGIASDKKITTIEGLTAAPLHPVQSAWAALNVAQCGYCQSGMIMAAVALLKEIPNPTDADIAARITNLCRCGTYQLVRAAIRQAAKAGTHG
ncbi:MAG: (2Fe-2S)-binding protein [Proteobacteria bacterium]|jgi:isoquinoline 1-oxidoreductase alpha subunit|nr:(2Fe-2S)-binding protein [Pseudomonadota bacterium]